MVVVTRITFALTPPTNSNPESQAMRAHRRSRGRLREVNATGATVAAYKQACVKLL